MIPYLLFPLLLFSESDKKMYLKYDVDLPTFISGQIEISADDNIIEANTKIKFLFINLRKKIFHDLKNDIYVIDKDTIKMFDNYVSPLEMIYEIYQDVKTEESFTDTFNVIIGVSKSKEDEKKYRIIEKDGKKLIYSHIIAEFNSEEHYLQLYPLTEKDKIFDLNEIFIRIDDGFEDGYAVRGDKKIKFKRK